VNSSERSPTRSRSPTPPSQKPFERHHIATSTRPGWKRAGKRCWLWTAATPLLALFLIHPGRGKLAFADLLEVFQGMITSDRWHVYASVKNRLRQICWAHLKRDFTRLAERQGEAREIGEAALVITKQVFWIWKDFRDGELDRATLLFAMRKLRGELLPLLERGVELDLPKVSAFCANLIALEPALWNFAKHDGIEPTNNLAERVIRAAVIRRKRSFGCDSDRGMRYVERILTIGQSCRLQKRRIHRFLCEAIEAHRRGEAPTSILPECA
jgi:transposase